MIEKDLLLVSLVDQTAAELVKEISGAQFAYTQSDEISILLTDFTSIDTQAWFGSNLQKLVSVSASLATGYFNKQAREFKDELAFFDSRVFIIPDPIEVENYFIWRQKDTERNSISMLAQANFSHKELHKKSCSDMHEMLHTKNINWNDQPARFKRGGFIYKSSLEGIRVVNAPLFTQERELLRSLIPIPGYWEK